MPFTGPGTYIISSVAERKPLSYNPTTLVLTVGFEPAFVRIVFILRSLPD